MKFLLDHDVYASTARFLSDLGHDVVPVAKIGLLRAEVVFAKLWDNKEDEVWNEYL